MIQLIKLKKAGTAEPSANQKNTQSIVEVSAIAHSAMNKDQTLREAALESGFIDAAKFDELVDPDKRV